MRRAVKEDASYADGMEKRLVDLFPKSQPACLPAKFGRLDFELLSCLDLERH